LQWCLSLQNKDGSIEMEDPCFDAIYKFPAAFVQMGKYVEAAKLLSWLENNILTSEGDFSFSDKKFIFEWHISFYTYANSWVVIGAQRAGFFDMANKAIGYILKFQNPKTGAFQSGQKGVDNTGFCDTTITSQSGICCLYTGHLELAYKATDALCSIVEQQDNGDIFYFTTDSAGKILKDFPEDKKLWYCLNRKETGQCYWYLGICAAFLCLAYEVSKREVYLQKSKQVFDFLLRCSDDAFASLASGKCGYASALLYRNTGEKIYKDSALKLVDWLVEVQKTDGRWMMDTDDYPWYFIYDCTSEMVFWISEIVRLLSSPKKLRLNQARRF